MDWVIGLSAAIGTLTSLYLIDRNFEPLPPPLVFLVVAVVGMAWIGVAGLAMAALSIL